MTRVTQGLAMTLAVVFMLSATASMQAPKTDEDYDKVMKSIGATFGGVRKTMDAQPAEAAKEAEKLAALFKDTHDFWMARKVTQAAEWAAAAQDHAMAMSKALAANDAAKAAESAKALGGMCQQCHKTYREKGPDGWVIRMPQ